MGALHLNYARTLVNEKKLLDCLCRRNGNHGIRLYFSGKWSEIKAFKRIMVEAGGKDGLIFVWRRLSHFSNLLKIYRGNFDEVKELWKICC